MPPDSADFRRLLATLGTHGVAHIVVGGFAAAIRGVAVTTFDLDIVPVRTPENAAALADALTELGAAYRERPDLRPDAAVLAGRGHHLLTTSAGPLDVLGTIGDDEGFEELEPEATSLEVWGQQILVLDLPALIRIKETVGREKDRAVLPLLRRALEERSRE